MAWRTKGIALCDTLKNSQSLENCVLLYYIGITHFMEVNMASKRKKTTKVKTADKKMKFKVPKDIGGVKIPKELRREGDKLIDAIRFAITSQATAAAFTALSRLNTNPNRDRGVH
jgi:hypothetical protein